MNEFSNCNYAGLSDAENILTFFRTQTISMMMENVEMHSFDWNNKKIVSVISKTTTMVNNQFVIDAGDA